MVYTLRFSSSKCILFHNSNVFRSCIIHILYTGCAKIKKKNNSGAKRLRKDVTIKIKRYFRKLNTNIKIVKSSAITGSDRP